MMIVCLERLWLKSTPTTPLYQSENTAGHSIEVLLVNVAADLLDRIYDEKSPL